MRSAVALVLTCYRGAWELHGVAVEVLVLTGGKWVQLRALGLLLVGLLLLTTLGLSQFALKTGQLILKGLQFLSLLIVEGLLLYLLLDCLKLFSLFCQGDFLFVVYLLLESNHVLLNFFELGLVFISFFSNSAHLGLKVHDFYLLLSDLVAKHVDWALFNGLLVCHKLGVSVCKSPLQLVNLFLLSLVGCFKRMFLLFESLFDRDDFFFFVYKRSADLVNLVAQFFLQLDDPLFAPLKIKSVISQLCLEAVDVLEGVVELDLAVRLFVAPGDGDLFNLFDFLLLQVGLELGFFCSFPHFKLPNCLIVHLLIWRARDGGTYLV